MACEQYVWCGLPSIAGWGRYFVFVVMNVNMMFLSLARCPSPVQQRPRTKTRPLWNQHNMLLPQPATPLPLLATGGYIRLALAEPTQVYRASALVGLTHATYPTPLPFRWARPPDALLSSTVILCLPFPQCSSVPCSGLFAAITAPAWEETKSTKSAYAQWIFRRVQLQRTQKIHLEAKFR